MLHLRFSRMYESTSHLISSPVLSSHHVTSLLIMSHLFSPCSSLSSSRHISSLLCSSLSSSCHISSLLRSSLSSSCHISSLLRSSLSSSRHHITSHQLLSFHLSSPLISSLISPFLSTSILICARDDLLWSLEGKMPSQRLHQMHFDVRSAPIGKCTYSINLRLYCISMPLHCLSLILFNQSFKYFVDCVYLSINLSSYPVFHVPSILSQSSSFLFSNLTLFFISLSFSFQYLHLPFHLPSTSFSLLVILYLFLFLYWSFRQLNGLTSLLHFYSRINSFSGHLTAR
jgi:hypothetical protein